MIKIERTHCFGWESAIDGMRKPMNSREKSDSIFYTFMGAAHDLNDNEYGEEKNELVLPNWAHGNCGLSDEQIIAMDLPCLIGPNDHKLMMSLAKAGSSHAKYRRMIHVQVDILAPLYWWKEFDTYKVGTVSDSCSTMHKIAEKEFTLEDFSCEHLISLDFIETYFKEHEWNPNQLPEEELERYYLQNSECAIWLSEVNSDHAVFDDIYFDSDRDSIIYPMDILKTTIKMLNVCRKCFLETKDKHYWWQMIQLLPSSYNQLRTIDLNYEVLANIYHDRKDHKLDEWREFCLWIRGLPYSELITLEELKEE